MANSNCSSSVSPPVCDSEWFDVLPDGYWWYPEHHRKHFFKWIVYRKYVLCIFCEAYILLYIPEVPELFLPDVRKSNEQNRQYPFKNPLSLTELYTDQYWGWSLFPYMFCNFKKTKLFSLMKDWLIHFIKIHFRLYLFKVRDFGLI